MSASEELSDNAKIKGELILEDPGKASELIQKFSASNSTSFEKKERKIGKKFSDDRLQLWTKKSDESLSSTGAAPSATRGVRPGGGDGKWLKKLEEEEAARKDAAATRNTDGSAVAKLKAELQKAGLECTERSRLLSELREKYSILSRQLNDFQEILGIANSARIQLQNNINRSQREKETEQERKNRESEEREALKRQAIEMRGRLDELMESDRQRCQLLEEMERLKVEFEQKEALATSELNKLTIHVKELTEKLEARDMDWERAESGLKQANEELMERRSAIETRELELKSIQLELMELKTMYDSLQKLHNGAMDEFESVRMKLNIIEAERDNQILLVDELKKNGLEFQTQLEFMSQKGILFEEKLKAMEIKEGEFDKKLELKEFELQESKKEENDLRYKITSIENELNNMRIELKEKDENLKFIVNDKENVFNQMNVKCKLLDEAENEIKSLKNKLDAMQSDQDQIQKDLSLKEAAIISLKDEMTSITNDKVALSTEIEKMEDIIMKKELEITAQTKGTSEIIEEYKMKESQWLLEKGTMEADVLMREHEIDIIAKEKETNSLTYTGDIASLQAEVTNLKDEKRQLLSDIESLTAESVKESKSLLDRLEALQKELDRDREINNNTVKSFEDSVSKMEDKIKEYEDDRDVVRGSIDEMIEDKKRIEENFELERSAFERQNLELKAQYDELLKASEEEVDKLRRSEEKLRNELKEASAEIELIVKEQSQNEHEFAKRQASTEIEKSKLELEIIEKDKEISGLSERLDEAWAIVKNNSDKHRSEMEKLHQMNLIACETAAAEALMMEKQKKKMALTPQSHRLAEFNILSIAPSYPKEIERIGVEGPKIPPEVILIDDSRGSDFDESTPCQRGPSLQSYVDTLNSYREKMSNREDKFLNRLNKVRDLESSLRLREKHVNDRIEKLKTKESQLFQVVKTMKDREAELKSVSQSFEKFRARLVNSCWDNESSTLMNKTLEEPDEDEEDTFNHSGLRGSEERENKLESSPTLLSEIITSDYPPGTIEESHQK